MLRTHPYNYRVLMRRSNLPDTLWERATNAWELGLVYVRPSLVPFFLIIGYQVIMCWSCGQRLECTERIERVPIKCTRCGEMNSLL
jgi:hypothetical protein